MQLAGATLTFLLLSGTKKCRKLFTTLLICKRFIILFIYRLETLFPISLLPTVVSVPAIAGHLMAQWHNIPQGTVVGVAMGDMQCAVYAAQPSVSDAGMFELEFLCCNV